MKIKSMQAAILVEQNKPLVIDKVELPKKLDFGQVLVKIHFSGICGSQLGEISGVKGPDAYLPHLLGHEGSGVVLETGPNVAKVKKDDHVVLHWRQGKGIEAKPPVYKWKGKTLNAGYVTTFNEYAIVSENRLTSIPKNYPLEIAPLYGCAVTTGFGVIENNAELKMGQSIVVIGSGGIGLNVIQCANLYKANPIIAVDLSQKRLELALEIGATHSINNQNESNWKERISHIIGSNGADICIDNTGNADIISYCYKLTKPKGRTILVGVPNNEIKVSLNTLPLHFGKQLVGSHGGSINPTDDIIRYLNIEGLNHFSLNSQISEITNFNNINKCIQRMRSLDVAGKIILSF